MPDPSSPPAEAPPRGARGRALGLLALLLGLALLAAWLPTEQALEALERAVRSAGPWGWLLFGAAYVAGVLLLLPGSLLTLAAGALFGPLVGTALVSLASTSAAGLAFLIARYLARDLVARAASRRPVFAALDRALAEGGWRVVVLMRLSPLVPFSSGNYLFGLTPLRFGPYLLASWLAMLPGTFLYVYLGHLGRAGLAAARGAERARSPAEWALLAVGLLATAAVTALLGRRARAALRAEQAAREGRG